MSQPSIEGTFPPGVVGNPLPLKELAAVLVRHYKLKEGLYEPMVEFLIGTANIGPSPDSVAPGAIVSVTKVGLAKVAQPTPNSVDAAIINPPRRSKNPA